MRQAASFTATEAVDFKVVDFIAEDLEDLLGQLTAAKWRRPTVRDGWTLRVWSSGVSRRTLWRFSSR